MSASESIVVITGGSRGIGRSLAELMAGRGYRVFATTRSLAHVSSLPEVPGLTYLEMDVRTEESVKAALGRVEREQGRIDILVNNAGISGSGPLEEVSLDTAREQFETNYFGVVRCLQAVLPGMRARGRGTIVNIGSVAGVIALPFQGHYCATKFALEALSEALAAEVERFGIRVLLIRPADIRTEIWTRGPHAGIEESAYREALQRFHQVKKKDMEINASPPERAARQILAAIESKHNRLRYGVGKNAGLFIWARKLLPDALIRYAVKKSFGL